MNDRAARIEEWRQGILESVSLALNDLITEYNILTKEDKSLRRETEMEILNTAHIIGATTAGAAAYHDLLSSKAAGVVLVEEAGEVLESHVLTALADGGANSVASSKHLILIGDHKQLPPKVENYKLSTSSGLGHNLDCSLFERLILEGQQAVSLEVQHRMRPSISALIRAQAYPSLLDHESVTKYPDLRGIRENLLFIDHDVPEDGHDLDLSTTKRNTYEVDLCVEVVRFMLLQGYRNEQLVVLTPYVGQLLNIVGKMRTLSDLEALVSDRDNEEFELDPETTKPGLEPAIHPRSSIPSFGGKKSVRCSSIDNYQGEEADIVVISCKC